MNLGLLKRGLQVLDDRLGPLHHRIYGDGPSLMVFTFHAIEERPGELRSLVPPDLVNTVRDVERLIEYYLEHGYRFTTSQRVMNTDESGKLAMLTFDDGYRNNTLVLPLLKQFGVPGAFAISTSFVFEQKSYWWDVVYRERLKRGSSLGSIRRESETIKSSSQSVKEHYLRDNFGKSALEPIGDGDRPWTPEELGLFSSEPLVEIVNHTADHLDLTTCSVAEAGRQVENAQGSLEALTGERPRTLAYPHGAYSEPIARIVADAGIGLAFTLGWEKNIPPLNRKERPLNLSRFYAVPEGEAFEAQNRAFRRGRRQPIANMFFPHQRLRRSV